LPYVHTTLTPGAIDTIRRPGGRPVTPQELVTGCLQAGAWIWTTKRGRLAVRRSNRLTVEQMAALASRKPEIIAMLAGRDAAGCLHDGQSPAVPLLVQTPTDHISLIYCPVCGTQRELLNPWPAAVCSTAKEATP
jgi:hypothetical protein